MKVFFGLFLYMFVGGLVGGMAINHCYEKTGKIQQDLNFKEIIYWPIVFGLDLTTKDGAYKTKGCEI